jgi:hypothetical protein
MNNIYKYINSSFKENQNKPYKKKILQKISSKFIKSISKEDNINILNTKSYNHKFNSILVLIKLPYMW